MRLPTSRAIHVAIAAALGAIASGRDANAQWRSGWEMHAGSGIVRFPFPVMGHGVPAEYDFASVPAPMDSRWMSAPNNDSIEYSIRSTLCDAGVDCGAGGEFTYFRTTVCMPTPGAIRSLVIGIGEVDDGARVTVVNSRFPMGGMPARAFASLFEGMFTSSDLAPLLVPGERNTVLITHVDDCCQHAYVRGVTVVADGASLPIGEVAESCNGIDDDCNGRIDDGLGQVTCGVGNCERTIDRCQGGVFVTCTPGAPETEICDSFDNDCDGAIDEGLGMTFCGTGVCRNAVPNCVRGFPVECIPGPPRTEFCNGLDDDCDGVVDDECRDDAPEPIVEAGADVVDATVVDACGFDARCEPPRILLEGRAGPIGCVCRGTPGAMTARWTSFAWIAIVAAFARRKRRSAAKAR